MTAASCLSGIGVAGAAALVLLASGCASTFNGPYQAPALSLPAQYSQASAATVADAAVPAALGAAWWTRFNDPELDRLVAEALQRNASVIFNEAIPACGTPLYTDVRIFGEAGIPGVLYGAGPRTVLESHAKRADERLDLEDLRRATKVVARSLHDLLG